MASERVNALNELDLTKLTLEDIRGLKNPVLREALERVLGDPGDAVASHQNTTSSHSRHSNHNTSSAQLFELEFAERLGSLPGRAPIDPPRPQMD
jgi:FXSXX-COOH protein